VSDKDTRKKGLFGRMFGRDSREAETPPVVETADAPALAEPVEAVEATPAAPAVVAAQPPIAAPAPAPAPASASEPAAERRGWFSRLKAGLAKSSSRLTESISGIFTKRKLDADTLQELEDILIQADLGLDTATRITDRLAATRLDKHITTEEVQAVLAEEVEKVLAPVARPLEIDSSRKPFVILMVGVNGAGKTTTIGKLARRFKDEGRSVLLAAGDTFRAAAVEQLVVWGERTDTDVVRRDIGADAAGLAFDALQEAKRGGFDIVMMDTAGRLQNKAHLMDELKKIIRVMRKIDDSAPHAVLLVLDATTGQNALNQAQVFGEAVDVTGIVMTKLDGSAKGGILVAIAEKLPLPVHFIGVGESIEDLQPFRAEDFARAIAQL
jgi:fused signal recognition particle receptor